ncbi:type VI secretion system tube protein Hcp [Variovorax sp. J2P1-59]|uniref:Hcp family type VI secretion system effector n=1 Tax=Variovorax flavidus TaxID=3053501 RepID=UPI002578DDEF|nr:type VI secretion system tube protein Hcp [Variovorax sp. J2P1-59]MDM0078261.1 type VI secretion system tube protein Hcp [Variovorax sp. J2P1-59]
MSQDIFLKLAGITGESQDASHKDEIEVLNWQWQISQQSTMHSGSGGGAGKAAVSDLTFDHYIDRASPNLLKYCLTGKHIDSATLVVRKAGGTPLEYLKITMGDVIVTRVAPTLTSTMARAREEISLAFARVKQEYTIQGQQGGSGGTVSACFDIQQNREC